MTQSNEKAPDAWPGVEGDQALTEKQGTGYMKTSNTTTTTARTVSCSFPTCEGAAVPASHHVSLPLNSLATGCVDLSAFPGIQAFEHHFDVGTFEASTLQEIIIPLTGGDMRLSREPGTDWTISTYVTGDEELTVSNLFALAEQFSSVAHLGEVLNTGTVETCSHGVANGAGMSVDPESILMQSIVNADEARHIDRSRFILVGAGVSL